MVEMKNIKILFAKIGSPSFLSFSVSFIFIVHYYYSVFPYYQKYTTDTYFVSLLFIFALFFLVFVLFTSKPSTFIPYSPYDAPASLKRFILALSFPLLLLFLFHYCHRQIMIVDAGEVDSIFKSRSEAKLR